MCPNNISNGERAFEHRLSVTCLNSKPVQIQVSENQSKYNPATQTALNTSVCNTNSTKSPPDSANFTSDNNSISFNQIVGISIDDVPILNALNYNHEDIFYPKTSTSSETVDQCLGRTDTNRTYHYRVGSSCPLDPPDCETTTCNNVPTCQASIANYSISMFINHKNLTVIGIAKDGHIIYGPYTSNYTLITQGFDICNGMFFDSIGDYEYFVTSTFPYIIGCFGPGNYPKDILPNCTTNPPTRYTNSNDTEPLPSVCSGSLIITFNFVFLSTTIMALIDNYY